MMKKECSVVRDVLPLYLENMVSEGTTVFVKEHLENCADCAAEWERLKSGRQIDVVEAPQRKHDAEAIMAVKKKIAKIILKAVAVVCLVFAVLLCAVLIYTGISYPVTKNDISLSTKTTAGEAEPNLPVTEEDISLSTETDGGYSYIIMEINAGKSVYFDSKTEEVLNSQNEVCGQKITLYNLQYHKDFSQNAGYMSWGCPKDSYLEMVVELEDDTLRISN
ncbi:MAG: zf-HC2 domain-containing protein [Lachnospiraceae bacterium]|nr:zf-HC2 domain-containing protein [Lachnospiraceae bacterium]